MALDSSTLRRHQLAASKEPASPGWPRQLHAVKQPQQPIGCIRDVMLARLPVMQSALGDVKKLRAAGQIKAQVAVHDWNRWASSMRVSGSMRRSFQRFLSRCDVYYVKQKIK